MEKTPSAPQAASTTHTHLRSVLLQSRAQLQCGLVLGQGLELAVWANAQDEVHYQHQVHHTLSVYLAGGEGSRLSGHQHMQGGAGRVCVLPREHESKWEVRAALQFLHLYVSDEAWADRVVRLLDAEPRSYTLRPQIYGEDVGFARWAQTLWQLNWSAPDGQWMADACSQQALDHLVLSAATPQRRQAALQIKGGLSVSVRRRVLEYVEAHMADSAALRLTALAQVACLSEFHFARMFHLSMGCTVHDWVQQRRLLRARSLLQSGRNPPTLAQLAVQCGFSNASHVQRSFRQYFGLSPAQWVQSQRGSALPQLFATTEMAQQQA